LKKPNATFHAFKQSGKWYSSDRGVLTEGVFGVFDTDARRDRIAFDNENAYPGLMSDGSEYFLVVIGDEDLDFGFPLMLCPHRRSNP
jgi:hypothetical protein